ncbi:MAG: hypothetical protein LUG93_09505 [Lachnospiraceae bacterium]|nr:hypothetical protein [Lachnospiraceae bacterium]
MEERTFLDFYKNTVAGYSNGVMSSICTLLVDKNKITFEAQRSLGDSDDLLYFESKRDFKKVITETTTNIKFANFYENWEFIKLYKYSLPLFWEAKEDKPLEDYLKEIGGNAFVPDDFIPEYVLDTTLKEATPLYWITEEAIFVKFVLQKSYIQPETFDQIDYRYPIVIYIDLKNGFLEIRYDANRYNSNGIVSNEAYESIVTECILWLKNNLHLNLYTCNHANIIAIINDRQNDDVRMYKQMMQMSTGASAELTASENTDYVLPFIGELRELIDENEEIFNQAEDVKTLLLHYLDDKEETASYPYIYIKWVKPVESQSYIVKVTFDYFSRKYTLLQHITGGCKDLGMERMNDAIKYLCESGSFIKGEEI